MKQSGLIPRDQSKIWAWAVLCLLLAMTFGAWALSLSERQELAQRRFAFQQTEIVDSIRKRLAAYEQVLRGGLGLFVASDQVDRGAWRSYIRALELDRLFPGVQGIGYAQMLATQDVPSFVRETRAEGFPDFAVRPEGKRDTYGVIRYLEPADARNRRALGYDMWSEPVRRAAMQQARDTGRAVLSGRVRLVQESGPDIQAGFLMYLPFYGRTGAPSTVEVRRRSIEGFIYSPFRMADFMTGILSRPLTVARLQIFNGPDQTPGALMFDSHSKLGASEADSGLVQTSTLEVNGQIWTVRLSALPEFGATIDADRPLWILIGGTVISFLVFAILRGTAGRRRAEALNTEMGRIIEESASEIYVLDADTLKVLYANRGAQANLGYTREELSQLPPEDIYSDFDRQRFHRRICTLREGSPDRQLVSEGKLRRKDGSVYPVEVHLQMASNAAMPAFIAIVQDITERKRAEEQQRLLMDELNHRVKNTLATVQSLAAQTLRTSASPDEFVRSMKGRLAALAGSHTLLTRTNWQGTRLADLVTQHLAAFSPGRESRIEGPDILLKPAAALAFGLVLHELTINAAKYGALSAPAGRVSVEWEIRSGDDRECLILSWVESGGPPVQAPARRGFGCTMIEQGLAYEVGGKVRLDFAPTGLHAYIEVPLRPEIAEVQGQPAETRPVGERKRRRLAS